MSRMCTSHLSTKKRQLARSYASNLGLLAGKIDSHDLTDRTTLGYPFRSAPPSNFVRERTDFVAVSFCDVSDLTRHEEQPWHGKGEGEGGSSSISILQAQGWLPTHAFAVGPTVQLVAARSAAPGVVGKSSRTYNFPHEPPSQSPISLSRGRGRCRFLSFLHMMRAPPSLLLSLSSARLVTYPPHWSSTREENLIEISA